MDKETIKKYWPYGVGLIVGLYIYFHYMRGGTTSTSAAIDPYSAIAQNMALAGQYSAANTAAQINGQVQMAAINSQANVQTLAGMANYNDSVGQLAISTGQAAASMIQAQSMLPAAAILSATQTNQTALTNAAQVAVGSMQSVGQAITASGSAARQFGTAIANSTASNANLITSGANAANAPVLNFYNALGEAYGISAPITGQMVNSVNDASQGATAAAGNAAAAGAQSNASSSSSMWQGISSLASTAAMVAMA